MSKPSSKTLNTAADLVAAGLLAAADEAAIAAVTARYALAITPAVADLIDKNDAADPIARQFLPDPRELVMGAGERADPIGDDAFAVAPGVVHRYPDRVLLKLVDVCPVYCRFCFRRESVGAGGKGVLSDAELDAAFAYIAADKAIWEVIVTGGDPLALSARRLRDAVARLSRIDHVKILRFHTRAPCVAPERITPDLLEALHCAGKTVFVALHANHPRELTPAARRACAQIIDSGAVMVSQSVLLAGVNDNVETLGQLMRAFVETRIKPYYLHQGDLAPGTAHLRVPIERGRELVGQLLGRISGLCQPVYTLDIPGGHGKAPIGPDYLFSHHEGGHRQWRVRDFRGKLHRYDPDGMDS